MMTEAATILCCPRCRGPLDRAETPPGFQCGTCGVTYPEINGIPRFAGETYTASFGRQWNRYDVARDEEDEAVFTVKTGVHPRELAGKLVLDAGCGGGRYAYLLGRFGAQVVGVDLSTAVEKARTLCADMPNVTILQGDLTELPLAENTFDFAFSIGVMHHGPQPRKAFDEVAKRVKPDGQLAVWLYRKNILPQEVLNSSLRAITTRLPARVLEPISVAMGAIGSIPLANKTLNKVFNFSNHPDWTLRVCDNFDWYAPKYQSHHTLNELKQWFTEAGYDDLHELRPARSGKFYEWTYDHNLLIGSGVNVVGRRKTLSN